jgi:methionine-rich copper-binding protein CopC
MRNPYFKFIGVFGWIVLLWGGTAAQVWAHAFLDHADPRVGSSIKSSPAAVRIWFDSYLEAAFSTIEVYDKNEKRVDKQDGHANSSDPTLLEVGLSMLPPGKYRVVWAVVSVDGHRTEGNFPFAVEALP